MKSPEEISNLYFGTIAEHIQQALIQGYWKKRKEFLDYLKTKNSSYSDDGDVRNIAFSDGSSLDLNKKTSQIIEVWDM